MSSVEVIREPGEAPIQIKLFPKQEQFAAIPTSIKEGFFGGAAGPGKSYMLMVDPILRRFHEHPRFHGILFRETYPQLEESLIFESQHIYKPLGATYNGTEHVWTFPSGAKIRFSYLAKDEQVYDHDTAQYNYVGFDELTAFTRFRWMYIVHSRCRTTVQGLPAYARAASNPLGIGHAWVRERFIAPYPEGNRIIAEKMPDGSFVKRIFIKAKVTDNPKIMKENPEYINSLMLLPEAEKRSKLYGDWDAIAGQVFTEFRTEQMPDEPPGTIHVIEPFPIPPYWPVILAIDWGYDAMLWAGFFAISPEERVYLCEEFSCRKVKVKVWGADLALRTAKYPSLKTPVTLDRSAWNDRGDEKTLAEQISEALGIEVEKSDSDRIGGKMLMHEYLRWEPRKPKYVPPEGYSEEVYERVYRLRGVEAAEQYKEYFQPEPPEQNLPKYQIFRPCKLAYEAITACVSDPKNPEDVLEFSGDDPYDGQRYGLKRVHRYFEEAKSNYKAAHSRDKIIERLQRTGDMTTFYREMDNLEETEAMAGQAIYRGPMRRMRGLRSSHRTTSVRPRS